MKRSNIRCKFACMLLIGVVATGASPVAAADGDEGLSARTAPNSMQAWLAAFNLNEEFFARFNAREPLSDDEIKLVGQIAHRLDRTSASDRLRWSKTGSDAEQVLESINAHRGELLGLRGEVVRIDVVADDPTLGRLRRVLIQTDARTTVAVLSNQLPKAWQSGDVRYRTEFDAVAIKTVQVDDQDMPLLVATHLAWFPETLLGKLGMDVAQFDHVSNRKPIQAEEREAFYQLLAIVAQAKPEEIEAAATAELAELRRTLPEAIERATEPKEQALLKNRLERAEQLASDVVSLFNEPDKQLGELKLLEGTCRRAIEIRVEDADVRKRFGITRYYELELFTPDSQSNPITVCTTRLPEQLPLGDGLYERIRFAGFFFKTWSYPVGRASGESSNRADRQTKNQLAPLLIAPRVNWISSEQPTSDWSSAWPLVLLGLISLGMLYTVSSMFAGSRRIEHARSPKNTSDDAEVRSALERLAKDEAGDN